MIAVTEAVSATPLFLKPENEMNTVMNVLRKLGVVLLSEETI